MNTRRLVRAAIVVDRAHRAVHNPARFVKNRAKSRAFGAVGGWRAWSKFWRA